MGDERQEAVAARPPAAAASRQHPAHPPPTHRPWRAHPRTPPPPPGWGSRARCGAPACAPRRCASPPPLGRHRRLHRGRGGGTRGERVAAGPQGLTHACSYCRRLSPSQRDPPPLPERTHKILGHARVDGARAVRHHIVLRHLGEERGRVAAWRGCAWRAEAVRARGRRAGGGRPVRVAGRGAKAGGRSSRAAGARSALTRADELEPCGGAGARLEPALRHRSVHSVLGHQPVRGPLAACGVWGWRELGARQARALGSAATPRGVRQAVVAVRQQGGWLGCRLGSARPPATPCSR